MTDDLQRDWHFKQLKWSLQALATAGSSQPSLFPEQTAHADDLAFAFAHWSSVICDGYPEDLSPAQEAALAAIAAKLATMSRDGVEFGAELWTDAALVTSEHWSDVRRLAQAALEALDWSTASVDESLTPDASAPGDPEDR